MRRLFAIIGIALIAFVCAAFDSPLQAGGDIEWRLKNPFRLFKDPEQTELHRQLFATLSGEEGELPILAAERALAKRFDGHGWAEAVFNNTCYNQNADRYDACDDYVLPKSHEIIARLETQGQVWSFFNSASGSDSCLWRLETTGGKVLTTRAAPCGTFIAFEIPYPDGARLSVSRAGTADSTIEIKIEDLLVVGLGDSFGAGEGNPDAPVRFNDERAQSYGTIRIAETGAQVTLDGYPARNGGWAQLSGPDFYANRARWWDRECHRSLYSHQLRAALQLAIENPQRAVTFLSFSCAGAEILDGVLLPAPVRECSKGESPVVPGQMSALAHALCRSVQRDARMPAAIIQRMPELRSRSERTMRLDRCTTERRENGGRRPALKRPIDLIFLSIGGNDVGFTPLIADSILSDNSIYRRIGTPLDAVYGVGRAHERLELLKKRLNGLKFALELFFDLGASTKVVLTGYPNMGYETDGGSTCSGSKGLGVFPPFQLDAAKVGKAESFAAELNASLADFAGRNWLYTDGFRDDFRKHGLCASAGDEPAETLTFPRRQGGQWRPYAPSLHPPYAQRQRWFRTPNDAFLTAHMHAQALSSFGASCSGLFSGALKTLAQRHWRAFQLFMSSTYGGAFHPTAEGQARMADEVVEAARAALAAAHPAN